jgi:hypothetical protein
MNQLEDKELFWKLLVWRFIFSIPLSMVINYIYYHSIEVMVGITITSTIIGYLAQYLFETNWPKMWRAIRFLKLKLLKLKRLKRR